MQDCHSPSIVAGLRAIPHLAIYRPGDPVVGRDLNPVSMLILRWRPRFKAGGLGFVRAPWKSARRGRCFAWRLLRTTTLACLADTEGEVRQIASMYDAFGRDWRDSRFAVCDALETSEFHVFRDVFFRSEPVAVHKGKRAAKRR